MMNSKKKMPKNYNLINERMGRRWDLGVCHPGSAQMPHFLHLIRRFAFNLFKGNEFFCPPHESRTQFAIWLPDEPKHATFFLIFVFNLSIAKSHHRQAK